MNHQITTKIIFNKIKLAPLSLGKIDTYMRHPSTKWVSVCACVRACMCACVCARVLSGVHNIRWCILHHHTMSEWPCIVARTSSQQSWILPKYVLIRLVFTIHHETIHTSFLSHDCCSSYFLFYITLVHQGFTELAGALHNCPKYSSSTPTFYFKWGEENLNRPAKSWLQEGYMTISKWAYLEMIILYIFSWQKERTKTTTN